MKLTSIEIVPAKSSNKVVLSFRDPSSSNPYNVKSIGGLDADSIVPRSYKGFGGLPFYTMSLQNREIPIKIGLNPRPEEYKTYSELRDNLYKMISSSRTGKVQLLFKLGSEVVACISGFVSKFESPLFEKTQEITVTIKSDDPMLKALAPVISLRETNPTADPQNTIATINDNKSTAPHGFYFDAEINASLNSLSISDPDDDSWAFELIPSTDFQPGDVIHFSSDYNNKYLYLTRSVSTIQLADAIVPGSVWPIMFPGYNRFIWSPSFAYFSQVWYYPTYWGV